MNDGSSKDFGQLIGCHKEHKKVEITEITKVKILEEALSQTEVKEYIEKTFGPTVNYVFKSHIK